MPGDECVLERLSGRDFELQRWQAAVLWPRGLYFGRVRGESLLGCLRARGAAARAVLLISLNFRDGGVRSLCRLCHRARFSLPRDYRGKGCLRRRFSSGIAAY